MIDAKRIKRVLLFAHVGIGNLIMFIPTIQAFKRHFSEATFFLVVSQKHLSLFTDILKGFGLIDEFVIFDGKQASVYEKIKFTVITRNRDFDLLVKNFLGGMNALLGSLRVPYRIGHVSSPDFRIKGGFVFNYPVVMQEGQHEIGRNLELFRVVHDGKSVFPDHGSLPVLEIAESVKQKSERILGLTEQPIVGMQIGTSAVGDWKEWAPVKFGELAVRLISEHGVRVALLGDSRAERKGEIVQEYVRASHKPGTALTNLVGKTSIMEAAAIIKMCSLFVSNDAGLMWVSQAVGTPVVAIYGPTDHRRTGPVGPRDKIVRNDLPCSPCYKSPLDHKKPLKCKTRECLNSITPDEVLKAAVGLL